MNEEQFNEPPFDFPILVADGVYPHFLEGFVSLIFYQIRTKPDVQKNDNMTVARKKEYLVDIRLPLSVLKRVTEDLKSGLEEYKILSLMQDKTDFISGKHENSEEGITNFKNAGYSDMEVENIATNILVEAVKNLSDEAKDKFSTLFEQFLLEHHDELKEIITFDKQQLEMKKNENDKQSKHN